MKYLILLFIVGVPFCYAQAQYINQSQIDTYCGGDKEHCGPYDMLYSVQKIIGEHTQAASYKQILHIETRRNYVVKKKKIGEPYRL